MATNKRDDFSNADKKILAERVGWICSFPGCGQATSGPNYESPLKSVSNGIAAHITAASEGGPRYDETLTSAQRSSIDNGIWMCPNHGSLIDKEETIYTAREIRSWKVAAEQRARRSLELRDPQVFSPVQGASGGHSDKDLRTLKTYADTLPFAYIQRLKQEHFGSVVQHAITDPLDRVLHMEEDPKYIFQDKRLEGLRSTLTSRVKDFYRHFAQQSAGLPQHWEYINVEEFSRHGSLPREYWQREIEKTQDLAALVCETALKILTIREEA